MALVGNTYFLFFSSNCFAGPNYDATFASLLHFPLTMRLLSLALLPLVASAAAVQEKRGIIGPVITSSFPDPTFLKVGRLWYAFSTNTAPYGFGNPAPGNNITRTPMATSKDFIHWKVRENYDALPVVGEWSSGANTWAPHVARLRTGKFVLYYSADHKPVEGIKDATHCVGVALSDKVEGPYKPLKKPFACPLKSGGAIDASSFVDRDGKMYVMWKVDGNHVGNGGDCNNSIPPLQSTPIMMQEVDPRDGYTKIGKEFEILDRGEEDGPLVEAPSMALVGNTYFLFFSSNCFAGPNYDATFATSVNGIRGPYKKTGARLLYSGLNGLISPGGVHVDRSGTRIAFHANEGETAESRNMYVSRIIADPVARTVRFA
jgi:beta-xylosidase